MVVDLSDMIKAALCMGGGSFVPVKCLIVGSDGRKSKKIPILCP